MTHSKSLFTHSTSLLTGGAILSSLDPPPPAAAVPAPSTTHGYGVEEDGGGGGHDGIRGYTGGGEYMIGSDTQRLRVLGVERNADISFFFGGGRVTRAQSFGGDDRGKQRALSSSFRSTLAPHPTAQ